MIWVVEKENHSHDANWQTVEHVYHPLVLEKMTVLAIFPVLPDT